MMPSSDTSPPPLVIDDEEWDRLWERQFDQVDRHRYGTAVWRGELPDDVLGRRVVPELARRWRRRALVYASAWGLFSAFWVLVGINVVHHHGDDGTLLPWACAAVGVAVVAGCLVARDRFGRTTSGAARARTSSRAD